MAVGCQNHGIAQTRANIAVVALAREKLHKVSVCRTDYLAEFKPQILISVTLVPVEMTKSFQQDPCVADGEGRGAQLLSNSESLRECPSFTFQDSGVYVESGYQVAPDFTPSAEAALHLGSR